MFLWKKEEGGGGGNRPYLGIAPACILFGQRSPASIFSCSGSVPSRAVFSYFGIGSRVRFLGVFGQRAPRNYLLRFAEPCIWEAING